MNEINVTNRKLPEGILHRLGALVLALCMMLSLLPAIAPEADAAFSDAAMDKLLNWGVVGGYPDGGLHPERSLTRAEFVAMVNRAYGYKELGNTPFIDVPAEAWFNDDINIAYNAKYFNGVSPRMAAPDKELTREQSMVLLARNMRMEPMEGEVTEFKDGRNFSDWSRGYARAAKEAGVIGGYSDGSFKPQNSITRGEMAVMLQRALGTLVNKPGTHTLSDVYGNVTVSSPNTVLKDSTIAGDLYITGGLSLGDVTLENVRVLGNIIVAGGGESQSGESVILRNVQADSIVVDSIARQYVSLAAEGDTVIGEALLRSNAYLQDRTRPEEGFLNITLDSPDPGAAFTLSGNLETVVNKTPASALKIAMGTVGELTVDEEGAGSTLELDINSTATKLNLDTGVEVTGVGDIDKIFVNAPGSKVEMLPDTISIRPGLTANIAGVDMNAQQAQESSSDPRLLAGYPKVKNIAPKSATSVYSANKGGTVYWAVSTTTNGSIGEEDLIEPTKDNKRIELNGNLPLEQSNTEYTAPLDKLTPDSNYYLSTILVDARGRHSPIKVASFATPDDTVPAFSTGYPKVMKNYYDTVTTTATGTDPDGNPVTLTVAARDENGFPKRNYRVQVAAMPNKTCQLYYALYPQGSTPPTAQQFRTGALGKPIRSGVEDATKNRINFIELTNLEELKDYDMYLCLIDADGALSSPVQKLTFKTIDGKPPRFQYETPAVTQEQLNALRLNANVNEDATIYWVATKDNNYIKTNDKWSENEWWERACRQIESGTNGISKGTATARANTDVVINVGGLQPATRYYIYFVAKDRAGNYSEFFRFDVGDPSGEHPEQYTPNNKPPYVYYLRGSTLDNIPPEATQEFTNYDKADKTKPYADTDILIHFTEPVMQYTAHRDKAQEDFKDLYTLYTDIDKARLKGDTQGIRDAENAYYDTLRATVKLYNNASTGNESVTERGENYVASDTNPWVIDYRKITVDYDADTGVMTLVLKSDPDHPEEAAINLSSGSTYHFELDDLCDTSTSKNRMGHYRLPDFTTISAQVQLRTINVTQANYNNTYHKASELYPGDNPNESIPIDMAFSMTPVSTSVEDFVDWDMLFWSDTSCEFEIYELDANSNGTNAVAIRPLTKGGAFSEGTNGHYSVPQTAEGVEARDPDTEADNYLGYVGQSYFNKFYGVKGTFPSVTGKGSGNVLSDYATHPDICARGIMKRNESKYYGIHFTKIGDTAETEGRGKTWDASITFRISVVTSADSGALDDLSKELRDSTIRSFESSRGVSLIHSPKPFTLYKRFANQDAPNFETAFPTFNPEDVTARINVMLDRAGTLYYAVVPASQWHTDKNGVPYETNTPAVRTYTVDSGPTGVAKGNELHAPREGLATDHKDYGLYYTTIDGVEYNVPTDASKFLPSYNAETESFNSAVKTSKMELVAPTSQQVFSKRLSSTTGVQTGSLQLSDGGLGTIDLQGLEPESTYLVYFSMQGTGQVYSDRAQIFQFRTTKINRPRLIVHNEVDHGNITSKNMPAEVTGTLFLLDSVEKNSTLTGLLKDVLDEREAAAFKAEYVDKDTRDTNGKLIRDYTVWEAICRSYSNTGGSLFDQYANEDTKNQILKLITGDEGSSLVKVGRKTTTINSAGDLESFDFTNNMDNLPAQYILLAAARAVGSQGANAKGHSIGFGGTQPIYKGDTGKPTITAIDGNVTVDFVKGKSGNGGFKMDGFIHLTFDRPLYLYYEPTNTSSLPRREALTGPMLDDYFLTPDVTNTSYSAQEIANDPSPRSEVIIDLAELKDDGSGGVQNGETFTANRRLCGQFGTPRQSQPLIISVEYNETTGKVTATVQGDSGYAAKDKWFPDYQTMTNINTTVIAPNATGFRVNTTSVELTSGTSTTVGATLTPSRARGRVVYTWKSGAPVIAELTELSDTTTKVTANSGVTTTQTSTIIATLYDSSDNMVTAPGLVNPQEINVTVTPKGVTAVKLSKTDLTITRGAGFGESVTITVTPSDAANKRVTYGVDTALKNKIEVTLTFNQSTGTTIAYISPGSGLQESDLPLFVPVEFTPLDGLGGTGDTLMVQFVKASP